MHPVPITRDLVLVGGGHSHVEVLRRFGMRAEPGVRLTLISREIHTPYSGMLPGLIAGHYTFDEAHIDLGPLARYAGARLYHDEVIGLDLLHQQVLCRSRPPIEYDVLSIDIGSSPALEVAGAADHVVAVKPVSSFTARFARLCERVKSGTGVLSVGVVGGGAGGVEILMAVRQRLHAELGVAAAARLHFHLLTSDDDILPTHGARARALYRARLAAAGVVIMTGAEVIAVDEAGCTTRDGRRIALDEILWVTHAAAAPWPREGGLAVDGAGFIAVDACLQSVSHPGIFAAGDIAAVAAHPRPKSGVIAVRQGPPLAANLRRALRGEKLRAFTPQRRFLALISTGPRHAIASRGALGLAGNWVWRWKDHIDRRFMQRYAELPMMQPAAPAGAALDDAMRCGGCGSKLGADLLHEALAALAPGSGEDLVIGLAEPDDAAVVRPPDGMVAVHTVDAFRSFIDDPWLFGRITANHCLGDIYAMGATPRHALALVTLPLAAPTKMRADLVLLLGGALTVLRESGTALIGGHTGEGAELMLGFAISGYAREDALLRKRGARPGDSLILTRALGSGVLLAAAMRGQGKSRCLGAALAKMATPQTNVARCLVEYGATALTDVTGFGLAGHLLEILRASEVGAEVRLAALPLYAGAEELAAGGIASSLYAQNRAIERDLRADPALAAAPGYALCFDPQTAGGLLASMPADRAQACLHALHGLGCDDAAIIGRCTAVAAEQRLHVI